MIWTGWHYLNRVKYFITVPLHQRLQMLHMHPCLLVWQSTKNNHNQNDQRLSEMAAEVKLQYHVHTQCCALPGSTASQHAVTMQGKCGLFFAALEGHLFCAECAATITKRSTQSLCGRAVEISLSLSCPSSDYLTQISRVIKCFTYDLMRDVLVC